MIVRKLSYVQRKCPQDDLVIQFVEVAYLSDAILFF